VEICFLQQQQLKIVDRKAKLKDLVVQARDGSARAITQYRGMESYLPRAINQSEGEILNSRGKTWFCVHFLQFM
jgi:hypothetical protein